MDEVFLDFFDGILEGDDFLVEEEKEVVPDVVVEDDDREDEEVEEELVSQVVEEDLPPPVVVVAFVVEAAVGGDDHVYEEDEDDAVVEVLAHEVYEEVGGEEDDGDEEEEDADCDHVDDVPDEFEVVGGVENFDSFEGVHDAEAGFFFGEELVESHPGLVFLFLLLVEDVVLGAEVVDEGVVEGGELGEKSRPDVHHHSAGVEFEFEGPENAEFLLLFRVHFSGGCSPIEVLLLLLGSLFHEGYHGASGAALPLVEIDAARVEGGLGEASPFSGVINSEFLDGGSNDRVH